MEQEEKSKSTREQYERDLLRFFEYTGEQELTKELVIRYKESLQEAFRPNTVNVILAALNGFFAFMSRNDLRVKPLKFQRTPYCAKEKEITKAEYLRLVEAAKRKGNEKLALLIETICGTGIRVSELKYITAEAVRSGEAVIRLKGKTRVILLSGKLCKTLNHYLKRQGITTGSVFVTRTGSPLDRSNIWKLMKTLCAEAGVEPGKVFPHNLRHLFARCFYAIDKDIAKLADVLGHSRIDTTRIYIITSGLEHRRQMDSLGLVV